MVETEIDCHNCDGVFTVDFDTNKNGNHVVECPECGHEHCRVIKNGRVTSARWDSRNPSFQYRGYGYSPTISATSTGTYYSTRTPTPSTTTYYGSYYGSWTEGRSI